MRPERTTDLEKVKAGHPFTWGDFVQVHEIGEYQIVECVDEGKTRFCCYFEGKHMGWMDDTLDGALALLIAYKYDGLNSRAAYYFMKGIGAYDKL